MCCGTCPDCMANARSATVQSLWVGPRSQDLGSCTRPLPALMPLLLTVSRSPMQSGLGVQDSLSLASCIKSYRVLPFHSVSFTPCIFVMLLSHFRCKYILANAKSRIDAPPHESSYQLLISRQRNYGACDSIVALRVSHCSLLNMQTVHKISSNCDSFSENGLHHEE